MPDLVNEANAALNEFESLKNKRSVQLEQMTELVDKAITVQEDQRVYIQFLEKIIQRFIDLAKECKDDASMQDLLTKMEELKPDK